VCDVHHAPLRQLAHNDDTVLHRATTATISSNTLIIVDKPIIPERFKVILYAISYSNGLLDYRPIYTKKCSAKKITESSASCVRHV